MTAKSNLGTALFLLLPLLILASSCKDMKLDIQDSQDRLDTLEGSSIPTIGEQISAINTSIDTLKVMDEALNSYIKTLETTAADLQKQIKEANAEIAKVEAELGEEITALEQSLLNELNLAKEEIQVELTAINKTIESLKAADAALDQKIADLQTYIDRELASMTDWANATFSTLTQYEQTQTELSGIKALIEQTNTNMAALETRLNNKIAASESSLKTWVGEQLTQGYYDIATLDGMLSALATRLDETDTDLQKQIDKQKEALLTSKNELTVAYKTAIEDAINENNGIINASIAAAVEKLENKIQGRLTVIDTNISNIQKELSDISKDIASIFEQIAGITASISDLKEVDRELDGYIKSLEDDLAALRVELEANRDADAETKREIEDQITYLTTAISALQQRDSELHAEITDLESYVNVELQNTTDWTEATFATLEQYSAIQTEIAAIKVLINKVKEDITEEYTIAIETAISNCEADMKAWVNTQLAQGYYNIAAIDGKVSALETLISDGDNNLLKHINEQKDAVQQVKSDLTKEYRQYIDQAIAAGGIIDSAIAAQVKTAQDNIQAQIDVINGRLNALEDRICKLEEDFVNRIQSLKYIPEYRDGVLNWIEYESIELDFLVTPFVQATSISNAWRTNRNIVKAYLKYLKDPSTRNCDDLIELEIAQIDGNSDGRLQIVISDNKIGLISDSFWGGITDAIIFIHITDAVNSVVSDYIIINGSRNIATNLSPQMDGLYKTANCYIVNNAGPYLYAACKGNSNELAGSPSDTEPIGLASDAVVLWESFGNSNDIQIGNLIKSVRYAKGAILFETNDAYQKGNAVIGIVDDDGNILWSWHIWMTDTPSDLTYLNSAGVMMDRNLGATSSAAGDVASLGLLYQWGRKDPFLGSSSIHTPNQAKSSIIWPKSVMATPETGTIEFSVQNPTTFIKSDGDDWLYSSETSSLVRWRSKKSIYDPCPYGYRVPSGGTEGIWYKGNFKDKTYQTSTEGINFNTSSSTTWYPACGYYYNQTIGGLGPSIYEARYWSVTESSSASAYYLWFMDNGDVVTTKYGSKKIAQSVRCLKE